jgi:hypothetical protein
LKGNAMQLLRTITPKGQRQYVDGRRVTLAKYLETIYSAARLECLQTTIKRGTIRHYAIAR